MAMINCPECGKEISDQAVSCPNCGAPIRIVQPVPQFVAPQPKKKSSTLGVLALIFSIIGCTFFVGIILAIIDLCRKDGCKKTLSIIALVICGVWILAIAGSSNKEDSPNLPNNVVTEDQKPESTTKPTTETKEETTTEPEIIIESKEDFINSCQQYSYKDLARNPDDYIGCRIVLDVKIEQVIQGGFLNNNEYYRVYTNDEYDWWMGDEYFMNDKRIDDDTRLLEDDIIRIYGEYAGTQEIKRALTGTKEYVPSINAYYIELIAE